MSRMSLQSHLAFSDKKMLFCAVKPAQAAAFLIAVSTTFFPAAHAQTQAPATKAEPASRNVGQWLSRMHEATRKRSYQGTFVVSSPAGISSARIWHACDGQQQMERVDVLTGEPRSTMRHNQNVITVLPQQRVLLQEERSGVGAASSGLGPFGALQDGAAQGAGEHYTAVPSGAERVAGVESDVVLLQPKDSLRFAYRVWSEKKTGLVVKLQTLDPDGRVLEQAAFSDLQLDAPVKVQDLAGHMQKSQGSVGYRLEKPDMVRTTAAQEGWQLRSPIPGFKAASCHKRGNGTAGPAPQGQGVDAMQWVFSDGLASVSLFVEPFDARRHSAEQSAAVGATHTLTRKLEANPQPFWLTAVGEVPLATLRAFASSLARR